MGINEEIIEETTVGMLGEHRVAMANMVFEGEYELPDGSLARGLSCVLVPLQSDAEKHWVGLGSIAEIHRMRWQVTDISKEPDENGSVTLKKLD